MTAVHCPTPIRQLWLYRRTSPDAWQVGFFDPVGDWQPETDHTSPADAAERVHWLNGCPPPPPTDTDSELAALHTQLHVLDQSARKWRSIAIRRARQARERRRARR